MLSTILKSFDTFVIIATKTSSIKFFLRGISSIVIPILTGMSCGLPISKKNNTIGSYANVD